MPPTHRVLLLIAQPLLGEVLENFLRRSEDIEVIGPWPLTARSISHIGDALPDVLLIAGNGKEARRTASLMVQILHRYPDLPVFRVGLEDHIIRFYISHTLPSQSADLVEAIRRLPVSSPLE